MISKEAKAAYDREYRKRNRAKLKAQKAAYFQRTYDPVKAAKERKKTMPRHVAYCRQDWYRVWKREYDKKRRSAKYGSYAEVHQALQELQREIRRQMPDRFERYAQSRRQQWNPINQQRRRMKLYGRKEQSLGL